MAWPALSHDRGIHPRGRSRVTVELALHLAYLGVGNGSRSRKKNPARRPALSGLTSEEFFIKAIGILNVQTAPISLEIGLAACSLPNLYGCADPGDCLIMATAHILQLTLVTRDQRILDFARRIPDYITVVPC